MSNLLRGFLTLVLLLASASVAAETVGYAAAEVSAVPSLGGSGIVIIDADLGERGRAAPRVTLNTDTLTLVIEDIKIPGRRTHLDVGLAGEAAIAGLLPKYYLAGRELPEYGFEASWAGPFVQLRRQLGDDHFLRLRTQARRWFFGLPGKEYPNVLLPDAYFSLEQSVGYTYWGFRSDPSHADAHRLFWRLCGFGFGAEATSELRSNSSQWVTRLPSRNDPQARQFRAHQWAALGIEPSPGVRVQLRQTARLGVGEDDITRQRVGGFNPYSTDLAGSPWPAFLSSRVLSAHGSLHVNVYGDSELGALVDVVRLSDPRRLGLDAEGGTLSGVGLFLDHRAGPWQADARFGVLVPSAWMRDDLHLGAFVGLGRSF